MTVPRASRLDRIIMPHSERVGMDVGAEGVNVTVETFGASVHTLVVETVIVYWPNPALANRNGPAGKPIYVTTDVNGGVDPPGPLLATGEAFTV